MCERKYAVKMTEGQSIAYMVCKPDEDILSMARREIGCELVEVIDPQELMDLGLCLLVDEEAKVKGNVNINCVASHLYGSAQHGDPVVGNALLVSLGYDELQYLTRDEATEWMFKLTTMRDDSVNEMRKAFHIK